MENKMLMVMLWTSELTPKIVNIISSNMEYGIKYNFIEKLTDLVELHRHPQIAWDAAVSWAKEQYDENEFWLNNDELEELAMGGTMI